MNYVRSNNRSLKFQRFTPTGCRDMRIRKIEFVAKTQFLCSSTTLLQCGLNPFIKRLGFKSEIGNEFCVDIVYIENINTISNVGIFKFKNQC